MQKLNNFSKKIFFYTLVFLLASCTDSNSKKATGAYGSNSTNNKVYEIKLSNLETINIDYTVKRRSSEVLKSLPIDIEIELAKSFEKYYRLRGASNPPKVVFDKVGDFSADTPKAQGKVLIRQINLETELLSEDFTIELPKSFIYSLYEDGKFTKLIADHTKNNIVINFKNRDNDSVFAKIIVSKDSNSIAIIKGGNGGKLVFTL